MPSEMPQRRVQYAPHLPHFNLARLGYLTRSFSPEEIAEARRRLASSGPWYTPQQVLDHLRSLETQ